MNRTTGIFVAMLATAGLAVAVFFLADPLGDPIYATPQEAFEASVRASKKGDVRAWAACLTDDARDYFVADTVFQFSGEMLADRMEKKDSAGAAIGKVFEKHGLNEDFLMKMQQALQLWMNPQVPNEQKLELAQQVLKKTSDPMTMVVDLYKASGRPPLKGWIEGKMSNVRITGNTAMGTVAHSLNGRETPLPLHFRKQGDSWRIDLLAAQSQPPRGQLPPGHP